MSQRRKMSTRAKVRRAAGDRPRLSVFRSNQHIYAQVIDDASGVTLAQVGSQKFSGSKSEVAAQVGRALAEAAAERGVTKVIFDRGAYKYHGRVKALADAAREGGLDF